jgi:uncharacterized protein YcfL
MRNVIVAGVAAFALVGCGSTAEDAGAVPVVEEAVETAEAPAVEVVEAPAAEGVAETVVE